MRENQDGARAALARAARRLRAPTSHAAWARLPPRPTSCAIRLRRSPGTRGCWPSATPAPTSRCVALDAHSVQRHDGGADLRPAPPPQFCARHRGARPARVSTSSMRASRPTGDGFIPRHSITCSRTTGAIADNDRLAEIEQRAVALAARRPRRRRCRCRGARPASCACSTPRRRSRISVDERNAPFGARARRRRPSRACSCDVGKVLWEEHVDLDAAKIVHVGERAEDVFYLTDSHAPAAR